MAGKLYIKVAELAAEEGEYQRSVELYEKVSRTSINNNLLKYSVKSHLFHAGIVHLASGVSGIRLRLRPTADGVFSRIW